MGPFLMNNFNFDPVDWHFCTEKNTTKLEKVQEIAFKFVYDDFNSTYLQLVDKAKVSTLLVRKIRTMALETFKI